MKEGMLSLITLIITSIKFTKDITAYASAPYFSRLIYLKSRNVPINIKTIAVHVNSFIAINKNMLVIIILELKRLKSVKPKFSINIIPKAIGNNHFFKR